MEEEAFLPGAPWALVPLEPGGGAYIFLRVVLPVLLLQMFGVGFFCSVRWIIAFTEWSFIFC